MKLLVLFALLAVTLDVFAMQSASDNETEPVILLTGFEPFGDVKVNPSWETVKRLQGKKVGAYRIETLQLPVVYDEVEKPLLGAIEKHRPSIVISFGAGGKQFDIETKAHNCYDEKPLPDNKSKLPSRKEIIVGGAAELKTTLPAEAIAAALKELKVSYSISTDAGGYLCNECFYRLMKQCQSIPVRGFIHVPVYDETDELGNKIDQPLLSRAVDAIVAAVVKSVPAKK